MPPLTEAFGDSGTFNCMIHDTESVGTSQDKVSHYTNITYNELSTLTYASQDAAINHLLSRGTHRQYSPEGTISIIAMPNLRNSRRMSSLSLRKHIFVTRPSMD